MEELIPFAAARNPPLRLRYGGDPMLETAIPMVLTLFVAPLVLILFIVVKLPLGVLAIAWKKPLAKLAPWLFSTGFGVALNALPWSSGKPFEAHDLPAAELPMRYREGVPSTRAMSMLTNGDALALHRYSREPGASRLGWHTQRRLLPVQTLKLTGR
jgi:hypothetical protein